MTRPTLILTSRKRSLSSSDMRKTFRSVSTLCEAAALMVTTRASHGGATSTACLARLLM